MKTDPPDRHWWFHGRTWLVVFCLVTFLSSCENEESAALAVIESRGKTPTSEVFFDALNLGDSELADAILTLGVDLDTGDSLGRTPLMVAAVTGMGDVIPRIHKETGGLETEDSKGYTALHYAVEAGQMISVVRLLELGANPNGKLGNGSSFLAHALMNDHLAIYQLLLSAGGSLKGKGESHESLATIAIGKKNRRILDDLLTAGIDLKSDPGEGEGLLHFVDQRGDEEMLLELLEMGLNPNRLNKNGQSLLHCVLSDRRDHLLPILRKHGADFNAVDEKGLAPFHHAILQGDYDLLHWLIGLGVAIDGEFPPGSSARDPLSFAIVEGEFLIARLLLQHGSDPKDWLYSAIKSNDEAGRNLAHLLLDRNVNPNSQDVPNNDSTLLCAVRTRQHGIARRLLELGLSQKKQAFCKQSMFHLSVARGDVPMVRLLLKHGADPNAFFNSELSEEFMEEIESDGVIRWGLRNSKRISPIMMASDAGNCEMAKALIEHGADLTHSTSVGKARMWPLTFATRRKDVAMMQTILRKGEPQRDFKIKIDLSEQRAYVYREGKLEMKTRVSTGKKGYRTEVGRYVITNKYKDWTSTLYDASMPYFQRFSGGDFGIHVGNCPGYAASHGCIRMPWKQAKQLFKMTQRGDLVEIVP